MFVLYRLLYQVKPEPGAGHQPRPPGVRGRGEGGGGGHRVGPHGRPLLGPGRGLLGTQALGWHGITVYSIKLFNILYYF